MLSYSNCEDDEAISSIIEKGMRDFELISKGQKAAKAFIKGGKKKGNCSMRDNGIRGYGSYHSVKAKADSGLASMSIKNEPVRKQTYQEVIALTEGRPSKGNEMNLLNKTKAVLRYNTDHTNQVAKSNSKPSAYKSEKQVLDQETNEIWKDKYLQLEAENNKTIELIDKEKEKNRNTTLQLSHLKKEKEDIPKLLIHQRKLEQVHCSLISQYEESEGLRQSQLSSINSLQLKLKQLRASIQNKSLS